MKARTTSRNARTSLAVNGVRIVAVDHHTTQIQAPPCHQNGQPKYLQESAAQSTKLSVYYTDKTWMVNTIDWKLKIRIKYPWLQAKVHTKEQMQRECSMCNYSNVPEWKGSPKKKKTGWAQPLIDSSQTLQTSKGLRNTCSPRGIWPPQQIN